MSLRDKYTDEEWNAIPPFTGFSFNKTIDERLEEAAKVIKDRCDDLILNSTREENYNNLIFKSPGDKKKSTEPSLFLLDEIGQMNKTPCYDSKPIIRSYHDDEIGAFGKVNLWDFEPLTKPSIKFDYPEINKDIAESLAELIKKENHPRGVIHNIVDKIHERKLSGRQCEVAIMSYSDYDALQSMNDFEIHSVWIAGYLLKIHPSPNLKDGEIEIY